MFDDPKKDLKWLEEQLRAVEAPQEEDTDLDALFDDEDFFEEDPLEADLREARALLGEVPARPQRKNDVFAFLEEETGEEEPATVYAVAPSRAESRKEKKKKKEKGVGGLVFLACLETLGIIAVLLWWVLWLL